MVHSGDFINDHNLLQAFSVTGTTTSSPASCHYYKIEMELGQGSFGKVFLAYEYNPSAQGKLTKTAKHIAHGNKFVALKVAKPDGARYLQSEARILFSLHSPSSSGRHLLGIRYIGRAKKLFSWGDEHVLSMGSLGCTLHSVLQPGVDICLKDVKTFSQQILSGVDFLHSMRCVHADLKPSNILFTCLQGYLLEWFRKHKGEVPEIRIIDFGISTILDPKVPGLNDERGTIRYLSPEMSLGLRWSFPVDIFSVGQILAEFRTPNRQPLFTPERGAREDDTEHLRRLQIVLGAIPYENFSAKSTKFSGRSVLSKPHIINSLLVPQQGDSKEAFAWYRDLVLKMLAYDPAVRISARNALAHGFFGSSRR